MIYRVVHSTRYLYSEKVTLSRNEARLLPRTTPWQEVITSNLAIAPSPTDRGERCDFFGNHVNHFAVQEPHDELIISATSEIKILPRADQLELADTLSWEEERTRQQLGGSPENFATVPFLHESPLLPELAEVKAYATPSFTPDRPFGTAVADLMTRIYTDFSYSPEATTIATPLRELLKNRSGVCQDFAHVGIACLRAMGLAGRYVSGYIETLPPPGQERLVGADASHAWFAAYSSAAGWLDFDPTNNQLPNTQHITAAWGRDFSDVSPVKGIALGGGQHNIEVAVDVQRIEKSLI
ncbi:MAG: transglutaminase [Desulfuromonas sp.]|nr:MAG: transglutaminase [Desulfuromonas sp.]